MNTNIVVLSGRLAAPAELREFESGTRLVRMLITTRQETPRRRVDVVPVTFWVSSEDDQATADRVVEVPAGTVVWVAGSVQRRFWDATPDGRRSRLEIVAEHVKVGEAASV